MGDEKNGQTTNDEPAPATPDILEKGEDVEEKEPKSATQDTMHFEEKPPKAKQDIMLKMLTKQDVKKSIEKSGEEGEDSDKE